MNMDPNTNTSTDYIFVVCIIAEAALITALLLNKVNLIGYVLPFIVAVAAVTITFRAIRDFFRINR